MPRSSPSTLERPQPPQPHIFARISGDKAVIRYRFTTFPRSAGTKPQRLITDVSSQRDGHSPLTLSHPIHARRGTVIRRLSAGQPPYSLKVQALSRTGTASEIVWTSVGPTPVPVPELRVRKTEHQAIVTYWFHRFPRDPDGRPDRLAATLFGAGSPGGVGTEMSLHKTRGRFALYLDGSPPYRLQVTVLTVTRLWRMVTVVFK